MSLSYGDTSSSLENRKAFLAPLGIDYRNIVAAKQTHSANIHIAVESDAGRGALSYETAIADTDGLITSKAGLPLAIFSADCLSVFLYEPVIPLIGIFHCGWRSTRAGILTKAIRLMRDKFNASPLRINSVFGPAIGSCCYEVGHDLGDIFPEFVLNRGGRLYLDLAQANRRQLIDAGLNEGNISAGNNCTSCNNDRFFSFRREGASCGRMISVAMLK
jgi:YfiH family protein